MSKHGFDLVTSFKILDSRSNLQNFSCNISNCSSRKKETINRKVTFISSNTSMRLDCQFIILKDKSFKYYL